MKYLKKGLRIALKLLALLILIPVVLHAAFLFVHSFVRTFSIYVCAEPIQDDMNKFMEKYGNRYFAMDLIYYEKEQMDTYYCEDSGHEEALLIDRYPELREVYISAIVEGMLDSETKYFNRLQLISLLERIAGKSFMPEMPEETRYQNMRPYVENAMHNVAAWWSQRLEEKAETAVAAIRKDGPVPSATGTAGPDSL